MAEQSASADDHVAAGRALLKQKKYAEAEELFRAAIAANAHDIAAHEAMATLAFMNKDYATAVTHFREATRCDASRAQPFVNLGAVYNKMRNYKEAIDSLQKGMQRNRTSPEAYYNLGIAYRGSGNTQMAISAYKEAIRLRPEFAEAHQNLGNAYLDQKNQRLAIASFNRALEISPKLKGAKKGLEKANSLGQRTANVVRPSAPPQPKNESSQSQTASGVYNSGVFASGISAPPVVLTENQRSADREIVHEAAKRIERSIMALQSELQMDLEPSLKKISKSVMGGDLRDAAGTLTRLSNAIRDVDQIARLLREARLSLYEHEEGIVSRADM